MWCPQTGQTSIMQWGSEEQAQKTREGNGINVEYYDLYDYFRYCRVYIMVNKLEFDNDSGVNINPVSVSDCVLVSTAIQMKKEREFERVLLWARWRFNNSE